MTVLSSETLHASCVAIEGRGILIEGLSGSGKSDLALRLIDRGARLVSDDYTIVRRENGQALASPPANITGIIEVRGLGLITMPHETDIPLMLIVSISDAAERMPEPGQFRNVAGVDLPVFRTVPLEASAPIKVELALKRLRAA